jgi:hypothetical protein
MANEVFGREEITLQDGTEVELRPLVISKKKKFLRTWSDHVEVVQKDIAEANRKAQSEDDEDFDFDENAFTERNYDMYIKLCAMCLETIKNDRTDKAFATYLEGVLDDPTIFKVLEFCGGIKVGPGDDDSPN